MINKKWEALWTVIGIFVLGFVFGALATDVYHTASQKKARVFGSTNRFGAASDKSLELDLLTGEIGLTEQQVHQVRQILEEMRDQLNQVRSEVHPRFTEIRIRSRARIRALLTADQQTKFDYRMRRYDEERKRSFKGFGPKP